MTWVISEEVGKSQRYESVIITVTKDEGLGKLGQETRPVEDGVLAVTISSGYAQTI